MSYSFIACFLKREGNKKGRHAKIMNNQWNAMIVNERWDDSNSDMCPTCDKTPETGDHVLQCQYKNVVRVRNEYINSLIKNLKQQRTNEHILNAIIQCIQNWEHMLPEQQLVVTVDPFKRRLAHAIQAQ